MYEEDSLPKAIELVREKRKQESTSWNVVNYTKTLLGLLEKAGEQAEYETELRYLVLKLKCQETEFVSRLKAITPPESWAAVFEKLLADAKRPADRMQLYHFNGIYNELFAELSRYPYLGTFQSYEEDLRTWDSERTLKLYAVLTGCGTEKGGQLAYQAALDCLIRQLTEDEVFRIMNLKQKAVTRRKKKIAAATYLYQARLRRRVG